MSVVADRGTVSLAQQAQGEVAVNIMNQVLIWIGFDVVANRHALRSEIAEIKDMVDLTEKDITELQELYAKRTQNAGRMYLGLQCTKRLKATLHWIQDFARVSEVPTLEGLTQESFSITITKATVPLVVVMSLLTTVETPLEAVKRRRRKAVAVQM